MSLLTLLLIVLVVALIFGPIARGWPSGYVAWSPAGVVLLIVLLFWATGHVRIY